MERRVKERLIGATILVVLIVLLVPEFLPGPHPAGPTPEPGSQGKLLRYTVDADSMATQPPTPQGPASGAAASAAEAPAAAAPPVQAPAPVPQPPTAPPAVKRPALPAAAAPAAAAPAPAAPASAATGWTVQLGSFASRSNAETLQRQLKGEGFNVYLAPIGSGAATRYRVRLGPVADRAAAAAIMTRLQAHQHAATLVPPAG